ncbi:MAG TPA: signal peptidase II [Longimicrobium sp.]|jgi:signal peptidase II
MNRRRPLAVALVAVVAADWITKFLVQNHFHIGSLHPVVDGWVWLAHRRNPCVAFSFCPPAPAGWELVVLLLASLAGIAVAGTILAKTRDAATRVAAGLVIAGAVGNLGDRLMNGAVTDFIVIRFFPYVFNVADVAITAGAILLALRMFFEEPHGGSASTPAPS